MHLATVWDLAASRYPEAEALVTPRERLTYAAWHDRVRAIAAELARRGVTSPAPVALCLSDSPALATLYLAVQRLGVAAVLLSSRWKSGELAFALDDSRPQAVVAEHGTRAEVEAALRRSRHAPRLLDYRELLAEALRGLEEASPPGPGVHDGAGSAEAVATILYTSGTTGHPKGVPRTHRNEYHAAVALIVEHGWGRFERVLGVMPLYHTMGLHTLLAAVLLNGAFVCPGPFEADACLEAIAAERVTSLFLVPTAYYDLVERAAARPGTPPRVARLAVAGAPVSPPLVERCVECFRPELFVNHYGCTEVHLIAVNRDLPARPRSVGRPGLHTRLRVVAADRFRAVGVDETVPRGEVGEVIVDARSPQAFRGYLNRPDATRRALRDGWYFTGDLGFLDDRGDLYLMGRVDDLIITGGENVYPAEVEPVLAAHPDVQEVAVVGLPDPRWGEQVVAFVVPRSSALTAEELDRLCLSSPQLARFKRPRRYVFVDRLPRSPTGKVLRQALREQGLRLEARTEQGGSSRA